MMMKLFHIEEARFKDQTIMRDISAAVTDRFLVVVNGNNATPDWYNLDTVTMLLGVEQIRKDENNEISQN